jgi:hypothetical protein
VIWPEKYDPKTSAIYALNDIDVKAPPQAVWRLPMMDRVAFAPSKTIEDDRFIPPRGPIPGYPGTTLFYVPYSHSIVPGGLLVTS